MPTTRSPRKGSLQFWPRKRASKILPSVNWDAIKDSKNFKGFICYKAGMASAYVKDNTEDSMTKGKNIIVPVTIVECPLMKIFSVRFYKNGKVMKEVLAENLEKVLKKKVKLPKKKSKKIDEIEKSYDDLQVLFYSDVKQTGIKKTPDLAEIGISGNVEGKLNFVKEHLNKGVSVMDVFEKGQVVDFRGLTKGKGTQGPVKRFGIQLRQHKSEKGVRKVGSIGPWHPAHVTFKVAMAGQMGFQTRAVYNSKIIEIGKAENKKFKDIKNFGDVKTNYILVAGSVQGPAKRQLLVTSPLRATKGQNKKQYELLELR